MNTNTANTLSTRLARQMAARPDFAAPAVPGGTDASGAEATSPAVSFESLPRFIRVTGRRPHGLIEFEFAIGWAELFVELLLPEAAFIEFCAGQGVTVPSEIQNPVSQ